MSTLLRKAGTADVSVVLRIVDSTDGTPETGVVFDTAGIDLQYRREGEASTAITEATLAALTTAHTDGGFLHIGNGNYRLDLPDAACAAGVTGVLVHGTVTGMVVHGPYIQLVAYDPFDTVRLGLTALPNAAADAAGGLPISDLGGLDLDTKLANTNEVTAARMGALTDWIDGGRLDLLLDDVPTTAEFNARTLAAAAYFDPAADTVIVGTNNDKTGYGLSAAAVQAIWDALTSALTTVGSIGKLIVDNLNATVSSRSTYDGSDTSGTTTLLSRLSAARAGYLDNLSAGAAALESSVQSVLSKLLKYFQLALRKDAAIATDNATEVTAINASGGSGAGAFANTTDALEAVRDRGDAAWITATGFSTLDAAGVNAEVVDALNVDTYAEPGQEAPGATVSLVKKIGYLYKLARNKVTQDATTLKVYDDAGTTVDQKATVSDDATTYTRGELGTGP